MGRPFSVSYSKNSGSSYTIYYYAINAQGDVEGLFRVVLNEDTGKYEQKWYGRYTYDAWGNVTVTNASGGTASATSIAVRNPLRYRGYYYDTETGFYYLQSRYYDPANHRFINADEAEYSTISAYSTNDTNLFTYCGNSPVARADDGGEFWHIVVGAIVGAASQYVSDVVSSLASGKSFTESLVPTSSGVDYLAAAASGALAASGIGAFGSAVANAAIDGAAYIANCGINGEEVDGTELLFTVATSALTSGKGADGANLRGVYKHSNHVVKTAISQKKRAMYAAKKKDVLKTVLGEIGASLGEGLIEGFNRDTRKRFNW